MRKKISHLLLLDPFFAVNWKSAILAAETTNFALPVVPASISLSCAIPCKLQRERLHGLQRHKVESLLELQHRSHAADKLAVIEVETSGYV